VHREVRVVTKSLVALVTSPYHFVAKRAKAPEGCHYSPTRICICVSPSFGLGGIFFWIFLDFFGFFIFSSPPLLHWRAGRVLEAEWGMMRAACLSIVHHDALPTLRRS
jgi:hypothetical protein